jgi:hypothetical protein
MNPSSDVYIIEPHDLTYLFCLDMCEWQNPKPVGGLVASHIVCPAESLLGILLEVTRDTIKDRSEFGKLEN